VVFLGLHESKGCWRGWLQEASTSDVISMFNKESSSDHIYNNENSDTVWQVMQDWLRKQNKQSFVARASALPVLL
jgi:hypothetical protein